MPSEAGVYGTERTPQQVRAHLAVALRMFAELDFDEGAAGHLTARDPDDRALIWMNPVGEPFDGICSSDLASVDLDGLQRSGSPVDRGGVNLHLAVYRARPDVMSVMHAHPVHTKAWSSLARPLDPISQEACIFYGRHAVFDEYNGTFAGPGEGERVAALLGADHVAIILRNHAAVTVGQSVAAAAYRFMIFDRSCHVQLLAEAAGTPVSIDHHVAADLSGHVDHAHTSFAPLYRSIVRRYPDVVT